MNWLEPGGDRVVNDSLAASSGGVIITASSTVNTKGAWTQITASTPVAAGAVGVGLLAGAVSAALCDVAVGGAGSETIVIPDIAHTRTSSALGEVYYFPAPIRAGTRIAMRSAANSSSAQRATTLLLQGPRLAHASRNTAYGIDASVSYGTKITSGSPAHTKSGWVQITASTSNRIRRFYVIAGTQAATQSTCEHLIDIAVGAGGAESIILPDLLWLSHATEHHVAPVYAGPFRFDIPAGTRLAARAQSAVASRLLSISFHGLD